MIGEGTVIIQHLKDKKGLVATIIGIKADDGEIHVGWSKFNRTAETTRSFTKAIGRTYAMRRAVIPGPDGTETPHIIRKSMDRFSKRCKRVFYPPPKEATG